MSKDDKIDAVNHFLEKVGKELPSKINMKQLEGFITSNNIDIEKEAEDIRLQKEEENRR